jgi:hypothetical protein
METKEDQAMAIGTKKIQHHYYGKYATTLPGPQSWRPCYFIKFF